MTKAQLFIEQRRLVEEILNMDEDAIRAKLYELFEDINRYGNIVVDLRHNHAVMLEALKAVADEVCGALCPSVKRTGEEWTHVPRCEAVRQALALVEKGDA